MRPVTYVRSLWGDRQLTFLKSLRDVGTAPRPPGDVLIYSYGYYAAEFLKQIGHAPLPLEDKPPAQYQIAADSPVPSMWWHKLAAIRAAILATGGPVIHLDWDTAIDQPQSLIPDGPEFQGRLRWYTRPQLASRGPYRHQVYHGGCMLFRTLAAIDRAIEIHGAVCPAYTDEVAVTVLADEIAGSSDPEQHRAAGIHWPIYSTSKNVLQEEQPPAMREGPVKKTHRTVSYMMSLIANDVRRARKADPRADKIRDLKHRLRHVDHPSSPSFPSKGDLQVALGGERIDGGDDSAALDIVMPGQQSTGADERIPDAEIPLDGLAPVVGVDVNEVEPRTA